MQVTARRLRAAGLALVAGLTGRGLAATLSVSPSLGAHQGYNDNVNAKPDDPAIPVLQEKGSFIRLQPAVRVSTGITPWAAAALSWRVEWQKYAAAGDGDALTQAAGGDVTAAADGWRATLGADYLTARYPLVRDTLGHQYLDNRGVRGTLSGGMPVLREAGLGLQASLATARRVYPKYEVITDATRPQERNPRVASVATVSFGPVWRQLAWISAQAAYQYTSDTENGLAVQAGSYQDYFSFKGQGGLLRVSVTPLDRLRVDCSGFAQSRVFAGRLNASGSGVETARIMSAGETLSWTAVRGLALTLEHQAVRYAASSARGSFTDNLVTDRKSVV